MSTMTTPSASHAQAVHERYDSPHPATVMSQTQGFVGAVVLIGVALAYFVDIAFLIVPAIIGTGLLVSGFTGVCPMAYVVGKMPWNRKAIEGKSESDGCCRTCG